MRYLLFLLITILVVGCGEKSSAPSTASTNDAIKTAQVENNLLESALNLKTGNKKLWDSFVDNGGLNKLNILYGLGITSISANWNNQTGQFTGILMQASAATTSPKEVRASLSKLCSVDDSDWVIRADYEPAGKAIKNGFVCYYIFSTATVDISIMKDSTNNKD
jgi:hypothetical protein